MHEAPSVNHTDTFDSEILHKFEHLKVVETTPHHVVYGSRNSKVNSKLTTLRHRPGKSTVKKVIKHSASTMKQIVQKLVHSQTSKLAAFTENESSIDQKNSTDANKTAPKKTDHANTIKKFIDQHKASSQKILKKLADSTGAQLKKTVETVIKSHTTKFNAINETLSQGKNDTLLEETHPKKISYKEYLKNRTEHDYDSLNEVVNKHVTTIKEKIQKHVAALKKKVDKHVKALKKNVNKHATNLKNTVGKHASDLKDYVVNHPSKEQDNSDAQHLTSVTSTAKTLVESHLSKFKAAHDVIKERESPKKTVKTAPKKEQKKAVQKQKQNPKKVVNDVKNILTNIGDKIAKHKALP